MVKMFKKKHIKLKKNPLFEGKPRYPSKGLFDPQEGVVSNKTRQDRVMSGYVTL